ncbi:ankyrin repeat domain-containing protein SOWAHC [Bombina bombina]|uniref:ankyrin repeat domain-containing protein SOWAHC n=1 Tax=Bombina bombina TaxID=8345 RepID=UPI00235A47CB|nr:ankyrin repeat domain-containing protein SOWAHC [Bombina bombina]
MAELSRESVIGFLLERGGRVPNQQLVDHYRAILTQAPPGEPRAVARQLFKDIVNEVGSVRAEDGVKYVCLRKRYRGECQNNKPPSRGQSPISKQHSQETPVFISNPEPLTQELYPRGESDAPELTSKGENGTGEPHLSSPSGEESDDPEPLSQEGSLSSEPSTELSSPPPSISVTEAGEQGHGLGVTLCPASPDVSHLGGRTPRGSRRGVLEPVSPQIRKGCALYRARDTDSSSLYSSSSVSGNEEEDGGGSSGGSVSGSAALDPLEHAWMLSSCRARWESLRELLGSEPGLIPRRDFITGFSCLHWAAKHGQHELLADLLTFARQHHVPVNINARAAGGYTALHLAAMHGHLEVIKLLIGAYDADVDIRDYSGRKAWQYLSPGTARDVQGLTGSLNVEEEVGSAGSGRWRLSKVLPAQLIVHRLSQLPEDEQDSNRRGDISRKGSGVRGKPKLNRIRFKTQIIHSNLTTRDCGEEEERPLKSPMRHRPKSNVFG